MAVQQEVLVDPNAPASASRSITVLAVTLTLDPLPTWVKTGDTVTFTGKLLYNTTPWAGQLIRIERAYKYRGFVGEGTTKSDGTFSISWTVPFTHAGETLPCAKHAFSAYHEASGKWSSARNMSIAYRTRIRDFSAPDTVPVCGPFTAKGYLEYESASGVWSPLTGKTVSLLYNTTKIGDAVTGTDGLFSKVDCHMPASGTFTLKADYAGEGLALAPTITLLGIEVGVPPELAPLAEYATYAMAAIPVLAIVGVVAYHELTRERAR
jgi:hypothetical protein